MNIEELKRLALAATPGPWAVGCYGDRVESKYDVVVQVFTHVVQGSNTANAAFIAAANPAAILELIRQRDELLAALKACRKELSAWMRHHGEDIATQEAVAQARAAIAKVEG